MAWEAVGCLLLCTLAAFSGVNALVGRGKLGMLPPPTRNGYSDPPDQWFTQLLDHSDPTNNQTFQQRYQVVTLYYEEGGPVFFMLGGETSADGVWLVNSNMVKYAEKYNALLFQLEHRYYGQSHPTSDLSTENLRYLTSEQALADFAYFATVMNAQYNLTSDNKWIAFGGSYGGTLAAWMRLKYPHIIHGAVSSSGPVLAKINFFEYMDVVSNSLGTYGESCVKSVKIANQRLRELLKNPSGEKIIDRLFKLCSPIDSTIQNDVSNLLLNLAHNFAEIVQYNKQLPYTIDTLCDVMTNDSISNHLLRYATVNTMYMHMFGESCLDFKYDNMIQKFRESSWKSANAESRAWKYQTCTEFGFYQTSETKQELFSIDFPLEFFLQQCSEIFGDRFTNQEIYAGAYRSNAIYGGLDLQATRVVYVHGTIDPWHALGITSTVVPESPAILINGTAHCTNMLPPDPSDPPALTAARERVGHLIGKWIREK